MRQCEYEAMNEYKPFSSRAVIECSRKRNEMVFSASRTTTATALKAFVLRENIREDVCYVIREDEASFRRV